MPNQVNFDDPNSFFDRVLTGSSNQAQFWARRSFWGAVLMTTAILVLVSVIWLSYVGTPKTVSEEDLPLIKANTQDVRSRPEDEGGMQIDNQDSTIFNVLKDKEPSVPKVENLLANNDVEIIDRSKIVEEPINLNDPQAVREAMIRKAEEHARAVQESDALPEAGTFPEPKSEDTTPEETLDYVRSVLDRPAPITEKPATEKTIHPVTKPTSKPTPKTPPKIEKIVEKIPEKIVETPKTVVKSMPATGPQRYVQLGSFKSQTAAQDQWAKMKKEFPGLFDGLTLRVQRADLGAKGVYYRVQAGSVAQSKAAEICTAVNAKRSGGCMAVKP